MTQFEVGDWVIITHSKLGSSQYCIVARVSALCSRHYEPGITVDDVVVRYDPDGQDDTNPNEWPTTSEAVLIERLGAGPEPAV